MQGYGKRRLRIWTRPVKSGRAAERCSEGCLGLLNYGAMRGTESAVVVVWRMRPHAGGRALGARGEVCDYESKQRRSCVDDAAGKERTAWAAWGA